MERGSEMTDYGVCTKCGLTVFVGQNNCPSCGAETMPEPDASLIEEWHEKREGVCIGCGKTGRVRRLVKAKDYNGKTKIPEFRCYECSLKKLEEIRARGVPV